MLANQKYGKYHRESCSNKKCTLENPFGHGKTKENKRIYEKDITAEISDIRTGYGYIGITLTIDLE